VNGGRAGGRALERASGQGIVEYGIILGLAALLMVVLLVVFDDQIAAVLNWLSAQLP
jgi:Flp pilus assembly pilin Flp